MWQTLTQMYGGAFLTAYAVNDAPPTVWKAALSKLTTAEAKQGIATLAKQGRSYPPNLTEVLEACRPPKRVRYLGRPTNPRALALPRPAANEEHRSRCLAAMRRAVAFGEPESVPHSERATWQTRVCTCRGKGECETCRWFAGVREDAS